MSNVKWIKIATNMFEDEKILILEAMEDGDSLIVLWGKLLCLCGRSNSSGALMITDNLPYSVEMLEAIFRKSHEKIVRALTTFERLGMIEYINDDTIYISNWEKHQSLDKLEKKKAHDREYQRKKREQKKLENKVKMIVSDENRIKSYDNRTTVVNDFYDNRSIDIDIEEDIEIDKDISNYNNKENPSISEVERFIKDNGLQLDTNDTYHYFSTTGWKNWQDITIQWDLEVKQYLKKGS